jgi:FAD:protein FMN transferase
MGTIFSITIEDPDSLVARGAAHKAFARIDQINLALSDYSEQSETWQLNANTPTSWTDVSKDLGRVLQQSLAISEETFGAFDPTIGALVQVWRRAKRKNELPDRSQIQGALVVNGFDAIAIDTTSSPFKVKYLRKGMKLDFGGIGKGYAVEEALKVLKAEGLARSFVSAGSSIAAGDAPLNRDSWEFLLEDKNNGGKGINELIECNNCFIASSGDLYQYLELGGRKYSHIIDPETGEALTNGAFVIVTAPSGAQADAYATAFCVMEMEEIRKFLEMNPDVSAMVWKKNDEVMEELIFGQSFVN